MKIRKNQREKGNQETHKRIKRTLILTGEHEATTTTTNRISEHQQSILCQTFWGREEGKQLGREEGMEKDKKNERNNIE